MMPIAEDLQNKFIKAKEKMSLTDTQTNSQLWLLTIKEAEINKQIEDIEVKYIFTDGSSLTLTKEETK